MLPQFNIFQQVFLVAYSILYGVMLQNISGLKAPKTRFQPWEADIAFQPFPWQQMLKRYIERVRLVGSIIVLNLLPFLYAIAILWLLQDFKYGPEQWQSWPLIFLTLWSGLGVFGFQRLYGLIAWERSRYFKELYLLMKEQLGEVGFDRRASVLSICCYIFPWLFTMPMLSRNVVGLICLVSAVCLFLVFIAWLGTLKRMLSRKTEKIDY